MKSIFLTILVLLLSMEAGIANGAEPANRSGGNRYLMDEWVSKKMYVKEKILENLKREGKLPRTGTIEFEARVVQDPRDKEKLQIHVDKLVVLDQNRRPTTSQVSSVPGSTEEIDLSFIFQPVEISRTETVNITFTGGEVIRDRIEVKDLDLVRGGPAGRKATDGSSEKTGQAAGGPQASGQPGEGLTKTQPEQAPAEKSEKKSWWRRLFGG